MIMTGTTQDASDDVEKNMQSLSQISRELVMQSIEPLKERLREMEGECPAVRLDRVMKEFAISRDDIRQAGLIIFRQASNNKWMVSLTPPPPGTTGYSTWQQKKWAAENAANCWRTASQPSWRPPSEPTWNQNPVKVSALSSPFSPLHGPLALKSQPHNGPTGSGASVQSSDSSLWTWPELQGNPDQQAQLSSGMSMAMPMAQDSSSNPVGATSFDGADGWDAWQAADGWDAWQAADGWDSFGKSQGKGKGKDEGKVPGPYGMMMPQQISLVVPISTVGGNGIGSVQTA